MVLASSWYDPVVGVDIHIVLVLTPAGPVPTPMPMPFVGMVFDPAIAAQDRRGPAPHRHQCLQLHPARGKGRAQLSVMG